MTIEIDDDDAIEMLVERVRNWTDNEEVIKLYESMYEHQVFGGYYDGTKDFNIMAIVDNDYINWCRVICDGENDFDEILKIYKEQGLGDCSCETHIADLIEAVDNEDKPKMFLVRV